MEIKWCSSIINETQNTNPERTIEVPGKSNKSVLMVQTDLNLTCKGNNGKFKLDVFNSYGLNLVPLLKDSWQTVEEKYSKIKRFKFQSLIYDLYNSKIMHSWDLIFCWLSRKIQFYSKI